MGGTQMDLDEFVERNERAIYRYCLSLCERRELAQEITQETFIRVMANYALLEMLPEGERLAWTFTTARNTFFDLLRAKKREEAYIDQQLTEEPFLEADESQDIERLLANVSPAMREVLHMKYVLGMNSREISEKTSTPEGTVRRRIQLGLSKIKQSLES